MVVDLRKFGLTSFAHLVFNTMIQNPDRAIDVGGIMENEVRPGTGCKNVEAERRPADDTAPDWSEPFDWASIPGVDVVVAPGDPHDPGVTACGTALVDSTTCPSNVCTGLS